MLVAHLGLRWFAPQADPVLLPMAALLNGMGYVFIARLNNQEASAQATWTLIGVLAFVATLALFRHANYLERYRYSFALAGIVLLVLPLAPRIGEDVNGARLWVRVRPFVLPARGVRQAGAGGSSSLRCWPNGPTFWRPVRDASGAGSSWSRGTLHHSWSPGACRSWCYLLRTTWVRRSSSLPFSWGCSGWPQGAGRYLGLGGGLFLGGAVFALEVVHHAQTRVQAWLDPWAHFATSGYQIIEGWFALGGRGDVGPRARAGEPRDNP